MAPPMIRWTNLVGALLLVLLVWTGTSAHAAERFDCLPVTEQSAGHFDGDRDEVPTDPDQGVAHHHSGCSGYNIATSGNSVAPSFSLHSITLFDASHDAGKPGREPDGQLRPPIA